VQFFTTATRASNLAQDCIAVTAVNDADAVPPLVIREPVAVLPSMAVETLDVAVAADGTGYALLRTIAGSKHTPTPPGRYKLVYVAQPVYFGGSSINLFGNKSVTVYDLISAAGGALRAEICKNAAGVLKGVIVAHRSVMKCRVLCLACGRYVTNILIRCLQ
jgi:hypothetical protein